MQSWATRKLTGWLLTAGVLLCEWQTVWAQRPPPASPFDGAPAAPEPYVIAMVLGGLGAVGGYVVYRVRKNKPK